MYTLTSICILTSMVVWGLQLENDGPFSGKGKAKGKEEANVEKDTVK